MTRIKVSASASAAYSPDMVKLTLNHRVHRYEYDELTAAVDNEKNMISSAVSHYTRSKIIIESSVLRPVYNYRDNGKRISDGFEYMAAYSIDIVNDPRLTDDITLALTSLKLELSLTPHSYFSKEAAECEKLICKAIASARQKADAIAAALNISVIEAEEISYDAGGRPMLMRASEGGFESKNITLSESVQAVFLAE